MKLFKGLLLLLAVAVTSIFVCVDLVKSDIAQPLDFKDTTYYTVQSGTNAHSVIRDLREQGALNSGEFATKVWLRFFAQHTQVKAGTYPIEEGVNLPAFLTQLSLGSEAQFSVSLVEGLTYKEWIQTLKATDRLIDDTSITTGNYLVVNSGFSPSPIQPEGLLLADTYFFVDGATVSSILDRAQAAMTEFLSQQWELRQLDLPIHSPYEALILASIIEKETAVPEERARIAGVFVNRLRKGMRLQTDPTVIYGIGDDFDGDITRKHLREPTPYNTYVIKGLPPTPIAMAGKEAIVAALNPLATDELYFVSRGDGTHVFSTTLEAHNEAVRKYQLNQ